MKKIYLLFISGILLAGSIVSASDSMYKNSSYNSTYSPKYSKPNFKTNDYMIELYKFQEDLANMEMEEKQELEFYKNNIQYCVKSRYKDYQVLGFQGDKCIIKEVINVENINKTYRCEIPKKELKEYAQAMIDASTFDSKSVFDPEKNIAGIRKQSSMFATYCN